MIFVPVLVLPLAVGLVAVVVVVDLLVAAVALVLLGARLFSVGRGFRVSGL